jgi:hypothetical protein
MPLAACATLALAVCAQADRAAFNQSAEGIIAPPAWVRTAPTIHPTGIRVERVPNARLIALCGDPGNGLLGGCTVSADRGVCRVYLNDGYDPSGVRYRAVLRHETAHCYGWPSDHSMARPAA